MRCEFLSGLGLALSLLLTAPALAAAKKAEPSSAIAEIQSLGPGAIDRLEAVDIGGIRQWISVRGTNPENPILLFLHGGPGSPMMPSAWTFQRPWEDFFTVVQWDQRGAGKTLAQAGGKPDPTMTIDEMQNDAEQVIQLLLKTYGKKKIFLVGHSWGSILGLRIAQAHPEWLYAYVGVGQVVNSRQNEVVGYRETLQAAREAGNGAAVAALEKLAPYPGPSGSFSITKAVAERHWDVALGGMRFVPPSANDEEARVSLSPLYSARDRLMLGQGEASSISILLPSLSEVDFTPVTRFECPLFFFAGVQDRTTPRSLVEEYFARIEAPQKKLFVIARAAHYVVDEAPGEVLVDLVNEVKPLATR